MVLLLLYLITCIVEIYTIQYQSASDIDYDSIGLFGEGEDMSSVFGDPSLNDFRESPCAKSEFPQGFRD